MQVNFINVFVKFCFSVKWKSFNKQKYFNEEKLDSLDGDLQGMEKL